MKTSIKLLFACLLIIGFRAHAQKDLFYKGSQINYYKADSEFVAIMQRPVTNREYIIYLMWLRNTFGPNYPEIVWHSFPGLNKNSLQGVLSKEGFRAMDDINTIISCCEPSVRDYMFNPRYLDYPVVGVSWQNANRYGAWLADRYNENRMIKTKFLSYVPVRTELDYFRTDAYVAGKWQGQVRKRLATGDKSNPERDFEWTDNIFIPAFRLPTKKETTITGKSAGDYFTAYPFTKTNFLYYWYKEHFVAENDTLMELRVSTDYEFSEKIICKKKVQIQISGELNLNINTQDDPADLLKIYGQNQQDKIEMVDYKADFWNADSYLSYLIISTDSTNKPIFVTGYKDLAPANYKEFKVFRLACSATQKQLGIKPGKKTK
ncbi:MAG: gliding motility lipoprotein GldJ [Bacteroidetes bacterium]|jgi:hypothetical protein|nr:gliding motility lipoprotein GldJ [Bacteroidota bacterium]